MKPRRVLCLLGAAILFLAGLGAGKTVVEGLREERVMSSGRRSSRLVSREGDSGSYWAAIGYHGVIAVGCFLGTLLLLRKGFRR